MNKCIKCGSYAFNLYKEDIDQGGLCDVHYWQGRAHRAEALAQSEQEPVQLDVIIDDEEDLALLRDMVVQSNDDLTSIRLVVGSGHSGYGLYVESAEYPDEGSTLLVNTTPPQRAWVGLTNDEVYESYLVDTNMSKEKDWVLMFYEAIEAKLKEKNNA